MSEVHGINREPGIGDWRKPGPAGFRGQQQGRVGLGA